MSTLKSRFQLGSKFEPCFSAQYPLHVDAENSLFCGRAVEDFVKITILDASNFSKVAQYTDDDKVTAFAVNSNDSTIFVGLKNLLLKRIEYPSLKVTKVWKSYHHRPICKIAVDASGTRLATGSGDTIVRLWHIGPKEGYSASCRGHNSMITLLCFHPTRPYLFSSALGDYSVSVWCSATGSKLGSLDGHQSTVTCIAFSHDNDLIATCGRDKVIMTWSCAEFTRKSVIPTFESLEACVYLPVGSLKIHLGEDVSNSPGGLLISGGQWGSLRVWNPINGRCLLEIRGPLDRRPTGPSNLQDSTGLLSRASVDYGLHSVVDLKLAKVRSNNGYNGVTGDHENQTLKLVLVRQSNHVEFYTPSTGKLLSEFLGDIGQVDQLCIVGKKKNRLILADASPQLKLFLNPCGVGSNDGSWDCHLVPAGHTDVITDLSVSACGEWLVSGSKDQSLCVWRVVEKDPSLCDVAKSLDVRVVLVATQHSAHAAHISAVCFDKATRFIISCSEDCVLKVWSLMEDKDTVMDQSESGSTPFLTEWCVVHAAHQGSVNAIDVSINNQLIATASRDKTIKIWKFGKKRLDFLGSLQGHRRGVWSVCFSTKEKVVLSASGDGDIKLWNLKDFSCIRTFEGHEQPVYKALFLSDDRQILSCDQKGLVRLWDVAKPNVGIVKPDEGKSEMNSGFQTARVFEAHEGRIWSLVLCPGESGFYTGGEDETLCFFKDITAKAEAEHAKSVEEFVQTKQALDNLVQQKRYTEALRLAVRLDQPKRALDLLQDLVLSDGSLLPKAVSQRFPTSHSPLIEALNGLRQTPDSPPDSDESSNALVQRLVSYTVNWNTRARTAMVAQFVLHWVLTSIDPDELLTWPNFQRTLESLLPYSARHYQRVSLLEEQLTILDYLCDMADEHLVTELKIPNSNVNSFDSEQEIVTLELSSSTGNLMDIDA